jgi:hypothetical protein
VRPTPHRRVAPEPPMNRYVAPLGFSLAAAWIVIVFMLVSGTA